MSNPNQPPLPLPEFQPPKRSLMDVDEWAGRVAAGAPRDPYVSQENRERRYAGLDPVAADLSRRAIEQTTEMEPVAPEEAERAGTEAPAANPVEEIRRTLEEKRLEWYTSPPPSMLDRTIERRRRQIKRQIEQQSQDS